MSDRPYTGPTDWGIRDGKFFVDGYPDAERVAHLRSKAASQLSDLRLHQAALRSCTILLSDCGKVSALSQEWASAVLLAIAVQYFACFQKNNAATALDQAVVFQGVPEALGAFKHWRAIRDNHLVHNESMLSAMPTGLVLGPKGRFDDVLSLRFDAYIGGPDNLAPLESLVRYTLGYVDARINEVLERVKREVRAMTPEQREKLPSLEYRVPSFEDAGRTRA